ncbi:MAG TPA: aquaporin [Pyrinomonadaceae bacterium]|jgi:glycerol uptake facilitator-like aquaporin
MNHGLTKRLVAETVGTAFLLAAVVGSGIMGESLAGGNVAIALLSNTLATGAALVALILTFGPISGAHFNPAVTLADASQKGIPWRETPLYIVAVRTLSWHWRPQQRFRHSYSVSLSPRLVC